MANTIKLHPKTGMSRQAFLCSLGGFNPHGAQCWKHWNLLKNGSDAPASSYYATDEMGIADRVTSFTLSDFGRSLQPNGSDLRFLA